MDSPIVALSETQILIWTAQYFDLHFYLNIASSLSYSKCYDSTAIYPNTKHIIWTIVMN